MGLFQVVCMGLLAAVAQTQVLQNCSVDTSPVMVASTEDAAALAASIIGCSNGDIAVAWVGEVVVEETIFVIGGTSLNITGAGPGAIADGGGETQVFIADGGSSLRLSDMTLSNGSASDGGVIFTNQPVSSLSGNTAFISNYADGSKGAIYACDSSTVSWDGDGIGVFSKSARLYGGATYAENTNVSWVGEDTQFNYNSATTPEFTSNFATRSSGGAIGAIDSTVYWVGEGTLFGNNSTTSDELHGGGAISAEGVANVYWVGDDTQFSDNAASLFGGAIATLEDSTLSWDGDGTQFIINYGGVGGGAIYHATGLSFTSTTFQSNSAGNGGAVAAYDAGSDWIAMTFSRCTFSHDVASGTGGAVGVLLGYQELDSWRGLAIAVVASATISGSSFSKNELYCAAGFYRHDAEKQESNARFEKVCLERDWNECDGCFIERSDDTPVCEAPLEHTSADTDGVTFETLKVDGGFWRATQYGCLYRGANGLGKLLCLRIHGTIGHTLATVSFLPSCSLCRSVVFVPVPLTDCAVCETDYSPSLAHTCTRCSSSRRQGLVAATAIAALVAVFAVATFFKFLLSTEVEEGGNIGRFRRRVLRAVPVQALKIVVVVWQILTQFADVANVTYPSVYQDFLGAIDLVNFDLGSVLVAGCLWSDIDVHGRLLVSNIGPLIVVGFLTMTDRVAVRRNRSASGASAALEKIRHKHQTALLLVTFLLYSSVSSMVFSTFACETLDDDIEYLRADDRIHYTDAKHKAFEVYAGIMVFVYPVDIPLLYAALLFQHRDVLTRVGADKTLAQPIAGLWEAYSPERFYYECGRRILLTGGVVFIFPNTASQIAITMLIAFFFFAVFDVLSPYTSASDTWLSRGGHVIVFLSMFDFLLLKVDVSGDRDQSQAAFAGVLVAGHVLMILAIVVEVAALCYASRRKRVAEGEEASERPRVGSDDVPALESAPAPWRSFLRLRSVSEKTGSTRSVSGTVVTTGGP
ncbi:unnamed protein product [Ectocarpus sp. CCAP 1310/34]|nr:unnamed protein product [Ectocarpus sp. CCAP 1310/34]